MNISNGTLIMFLPIIVFIIFLFKIHANKNLKNAYKNSLLLSLIGVVVIFVSFAISPRVSDIRTTWLISGAIFILYGGYYALKHNDKESDDSKQ